jgi:hypothetical protein
VAAGGRGIVVKFAARPAPCAGILEFQARVRRIISAGPSSSTNWNSAVHEIPANCAGNLAAPSVSAMARRTPRRGTALDQHARGDHRCEQAQYPGLGLGGFRQPRPQTGRHWLADYNERELACGYYARGTHVSSPLPKS